MESVLIIFIITGGFSFLSYLSYLERKKLHLLIKSADLIEVKQYETAKGIDEDHTKLEDSIPENLVDMFDGKSPDEINASFRN